MESWSTSKQLVYLLGLLFVFRTVQISPLLEKEKEGKKKSVTSEPFHFEVMFKKIMALKPHF